MPLTERLLQHKIAKMKPKASLTVDEQILLRTKEAKLYKLTEFSVKWQGQLADLQAEKEVRFLRSRGQGEDADVLQILKHGITQYRKVLRRLNASRVQALQEIYDFYVNRRLN